MAATALEYPRVEYASDLEWAKTHRETARAQGWSMPYNADPNGVLTRKLVTCNPTRISPDSVWPYCAGRAHQGDPVAARALAIVCGSKARWAHRLDALNGAVPIVGDQGHLEEAVSRGWEIVETISGLRVEAVEGQEQHDSDDDLLNALESEASEGDDLAARALTIHYSEAAMYFRALFEADRNLARGGVPIGPVTTPEAEGAAKMVF